MRVLPVVLMAALLLFNTLGCDNARIAGPDIEAEALPPQARSAVMSQKAWSSEADPFADEVIEDGINDQGQGFVDPIGILGNLEVLIPDKTPPLVSLGEGGFVVVDMGEGEEIKSGPGYDFMVVEADGSLLAAGFGGAEPYTVSVSNSPTGPFTSLGTANGNGFFDLGGTGVSSARYVRFDDAGGFPPSNADLQGIVAFNMNGANLNLTPSTIERSSASEHITGHVQLPHDYDLAAASIALVAAIDQPSPTPPQYVSTLDIPGTVGGVGNVVTFSQEAFLNEAVDGENIVVAVKLTSASGEVKYLFDLVNVQP